MPQNIKKYFDLYLEQLTYSTKEEKKFIIKHLTVETFNKGDYFLKFGEIQSDMGFVCEGLIRRFYINEKGNKITTGFTKELEYVTDYPSFIRQIPTKYYLQCLEHTTIVRLPYPAIIESYEKFKNSEMQGRLIAEKVLTILNDRVESFLFNTAEERYLKFINENPDLIQRVSLTHLSSFIGIERQSLSRIRNRISKK
ncbi:Cyclic nucleotide-binding domain-containing protein [Maribacter dokdonensis]|uniref:Cyclic nucleotide-binding domain-containing protein n=1 Tax=Maribacter dokdonensis TaxID=320912 RepID=A0A1H4UQY4_9FLAO|nr:cyclic nucleotide-binding domain-containing protein [Maribacter dokdonensis]SEC71272.1 Cyclic nucleotide-binding domain-containing protein [Maribacter dokdonensis]